MPSYLRALKISEGSTKVPMHSIAVARAGGATGGMVLQVSGLPPHPDQIFDMTFVSKSGLFSQSRLWRTVFIFHFIFRATFLFLSKPLPSLS